MIARLFTIVLVALALGGCAEPPYNNVDNSQLKTLIAQGIPLYDVRRPEEWRETGVVKDSRKLTFVDAAGRMNPEFLPDFTARVGKNDPVILICRTGNRTGSLARELADLGYTQIYNVRDGITRWISEGHPVVRN
ncbi:MAG: rhodanese-like domain-containing protein [Pseudomonadota bacterium]|nr:sulfurtransferase [Gammaproteobacteria bacterium]MBU1732091.1 sulfurtransferase [Gammaproteobacteria bacterium]MBU1893379.1 sulfurtransferase [Gammaproteobacteria bacterium]